MNKEIIGKCPICGKDMKASKLECSHCNITIEGKFEPCKFCKLDSSQKSFIEVFIKNRGNIKEIEKELKISYPTVKNKLDDVITALGYKDTSQPSVDKKSILDDLSSGKINAEEALKLLK